MVPGYKKRLAAFCPASGRGAIKDLGLDWGKLLNPKSEATLPQSSAPLAEEDSNRGVLHNEILPFRAGAPKHGL